MDPMEFRAFLDLMMCCDPWPVDGSGNQETIVFFANRKSVERGYSDWIDAYHNHVA